MEKFLSKFSKNIIYFFADSGLSNPSTKFLNPRSHWSTGKQLKPNSLGESLFFWEVVSLLAMPAQSPDCQLGLFKKWWFWWGYLLWLFVSSLSSAQWHWLRYICKTFIYIILCCFISTFSLYVSIRDNLKYLGQKQNYLNPAIFENIHACIVKNLLTWCWLLKPRPSAFFLLFHRTYIQPFDRNYEVLLTFQPI